MRKTLAFIVVGITALILIPIIMVSVKHQQDVRSRAAPATTLTLLPAQLQKNAGDTFTLDIHIDTGTNDVTLAKIDLIFDATALEALSITNGPLAPRIYSPGTVSPGNAGISIGAESELKPISGSGTIAVIRLKVIGTSATPVSLQFSSATVVSGLSETINVLTGTTPAILTIAGGQSQGTTLTPTPTLTPQPTSGLTSTPTISPTPTSTQSGTLVTGLTQEPLPQSGSIETTLLLIGIASFFIISGLAISL